MKENVIIVYRFICLIFILVRLIGINIMNKKNKDYYKNLFKQANFKPCKAPKDFPPGGECFEFDPEYGTGY